MAEKLGNENREDSQEEKQYSVKRICAWCGKDMGFADHTSREEGEVTHGICGDCEKKFEEGK